uniref:Laminin EGF-like domain-containing protein n=1 Tax=Macrostomum lignano TaxID=282301 RepID=A0A1I8F8K5_9PLAT
MPPASSWSDGFSLACNSSTGGLSLSTWLLQYRFPLAQRCGCYAIGSVSDACEKQANSASFKCTCRPGVTGSHCNRCQSPFAELTSTGCTRAVRPVSAKSTFGRWHLWPNTLQGQLTTVPCPAGYVRLSQPAPLPKPFLRASAGSYALIGLTCLLHLYHSSVCLAVARRCGNSLTYWTRFHASLSAYWFWHGAKADCCGLATSRFIGCLLPAGSMGFTLALAGHLFTSDGA